VADKQTGIRNNVHILRLVSDMPDDVLQKGIATELGIKWRVSDGNMDFICGHRTNREYVEAGTPIGNFEFSNVLCHGWHEDTFPDWCGSLDEMYNLVEGLDIADKTKYIQCLCYMFLRNGIDRRGGDGIQDKLLLYVAQAPALDRAKSWLMVKYIRRAESLVGSQESA
jgi:hypothetical protein